MRFLAIVKCVYLTDIQVQQNSNNKYLDSFHVITMVRDVHFSDYIWRLFERNGAFFAKVVPEI